MDLLKFLPCLRPFGDHLTILCDFLEKTEQISPFPAFKGNRLFGKSTRGDLVVFDPAKISAKEVAVSYLKLRAITNLSSASVRARDLFMSNHLCQEVASTLKFGKHELARPEVT